MTASSNATLFAPASPDEDIGLGLLSSMISGATTGSGDIIAQMRDLFQNMLAIYSSAFLVIAAFAVLYQIIFTVADAARTGRAFRKINPLWGPIRLVMVIGLLVPLGGGLNSGQRIVTTLAEWGSGLATQIWTEATQNVELLHPMINRPDPPSALGLVESLILRNACMLYTNRIVDELTKERNREEHERRRMGIDTPLPEPPLQHVTELDKRNNPDGSITQPYGWAARPYFCGAVTFIPFDREQDLPPYALLKQAHTEGLVILNRATEDAALGYVGDLASTSTPSMVRLNNLANTYEDTIRRAMGDDFQRFTNLRLEAIRSRALAGGWVTAPTYLNDVLQLNVGTIAAVKSLPHVDLPEILLDPPPLPAGTRVADTGEYQIYTVLNRIIGSWDISTSLVAAGGRGLEGLTTSLEQAILAIVQAPEGGETAHKLRSLRQLMHVDSNDWKSFQQGNPLVILADLGVYLEGKSYELLAGAGVLKDIGAVADPTVSILTVLAWLSFACSLALLIVLPLIPLVRFIIGVMVWLLQVLEALIAIPLVALAHVRLEDDGLAGRSAILAYLLILKVMLRPPLMVLGFLGGLLILMLSLGIVNKLLLAMLPVISGSGDIANFWFVIILAFYAILVLGFANACFKLIDLLPERVLLWISGLAQPERGGSHPDNSASGTVITS